MKVIAWLTEGTWEACVDATAQIAPADCEIVLLHVTDPAVPESLHGAFAGLVGRGGHGLDPGDAVESATRSAEEALFAAAESRLGRDATRKPAAVVPNVRLSRPPRMPPSSSWLGTATTHGSVRTASGALPGLSWTTRRVACCSSGRTNRRRWTPFRHRQSTTTAVDGVRPRSQASRKCFRFPDGGQLTLDYVKLAAADENHEQLVVFLPASDADAATLADLR